MILPGPLYEDKAVLMQHHFPPQNLDAILPQPHQDPILLYLLEWQLHGWRMAERSDSTCKVRRGGCEEIPLVQSKEQWLHFAGAAVKRYCTSKVRETQVRQ